LTDQPFPEFKSNMKYINKRFIDEYRQLEQQDN